MKTVNQLISQKSKVKRTIVCLSFFIFHFSFLIAFTQSIQVQNAYMYLGEKKYDKAKAAADASVTNESTQSVPKAWMYRAKIYQKIYQDTSEKTNGLDPDAVEKSVESYVKCLQLDKDKIYKDNEEVKEGLRTSVGALKKKVEKFYMSAGEYDKAINAIGILKTTLPYDFGEVLKRQNVTTENLMYLEYQAYYTANKDAAKTKELGDKLMAISFKIPLIYSTMAKLSLTQKDTASALSCLDKGLALFEDNLDLLTMQIDILIAQKKNDLLKQN